MGLRDIGATLPPGFRFYPNDEELVCHYLYKKITNDEEVLKGTLVEIDLHTCEPWQLPGRPSLSPPINFLGFFIKTINSENKNHFQIIPKRCFWCFQKKFSKKVFKNSNQTSLIVYTHSCWCALSWLEDTPIIKNVSSCFCYSD